VLRAFFFAIESLFDAKVLKMLFFFLMERSSTIQKRSNGDINWIQICF